MCDPISSSALAWTLGAVGLLSAGGTAYGVYESKKQAKAANAAMENAAKTNTSQIEVYDPGVSVEYGEAPEAPEAAPVMTTADEGADETKLKKKGRNALVIDRTQTTNTGLSGGSGVNVPGV